MEGSNFGYYYHLINTSHDVTESRNKQDIVQIRPLVRHNLYSEFKKLDIGGQLHLKWISQFFLWFI
jgi:hypothetical protein